MHSDALFERYYSMPTELFNTSVNNIQTVVSLLLHLLYLLIQVLVVALELCYSLCRLLYFVLRFMIPDLLLLLFNPQQFITLISVAYNLIIFNIQR